MERLILSLDVSNVMDYVEYVSDTPAIPECPDPLCPHETTMWDEGDPGYYATRWEPGDPGYDPGFYCIDGCGYYLSIYEDPRVWDLAHALGFLDKTWEEHLEHEKKAMEAMSEYYRQCEEDEKKHCW